MRLRTRTVRRDDDGRAQTCAALLRVLPSAAEQASPTVFLGGALVAAISGDGATLGRGLQNTVVLPDPAVSREQAHIERTQDGWRIHNVSAKRSLFVGGVEVAPGEAMPLTPGDTIAVGATPLEFVAPRMSAALAAQRASDAAGDELNVFAPGVTLQFALRSRRVTRFWWPTAALVALLCALSAVIAVGAALLVGRHALAVGGPGQILAAATVPLVPVVGAGALVPLLDRYERESLIVMCAAFVWGAIIAIPPVVGVEHVILRLLLGVGASGALHSFGQAGVQAAVAALTEETFKGAGLLALIAVAHDEFDNITDGVLYGLLIGAGFALAENFAYFALTPRADLGFLVLGRILLGWLSHSTFTALLGAGLGYARERGALRRHWQAPALGFVAACALHLYFDFAVFATDVAARNGWALGSTRAFIALALLVAYGPLFVTQAALLRVTLAALRREAEVVRAHLDDEVIGGVLTPEEYLLAQNAGLRDHAERAILVSRGARAYLTVRALHQAITGLAFRKWHVTLGDVAKPGARQPEDAYRERIARLRDALLRQLAPANTQDERVVGGGDAGDVILGVAQDEEATERDELLVQRVFERTDQRRGQGEPADRTLLDVQAEIPVDDRDVGGGG
ncbi:MAG TPA: PrsW family glutamic-type intramembrane protease [Ktedonobacterales bacterium]|nr:PrsW family glutamic-type intramembrane protease [Ktedonobacterales bacterium]